MITLAASTRCNRNSGARCLLSDRLHADKNKLRRCIATLYSSASSSFLTSAFLALALIRPLAVYFFKDLANRSPARGQQKWSCHQIYLPVGFQFYSITCSTRCYCIVSQPLFVTAQRGHSFQAGRSPPRRGGKFS